MFCCTANPGSLLDAFSKHYAMSLQTFSFPFPETRFIRAGRMIYKLRIRAGSSCSGDEMVGRNFSQELEDIIRTVLGNLDSLQPFSCTHFNVFPYKQEWEGVSKVMCKHSEKKLRVYPFILILYMEKNTKNEKQAEEDLNPNKEVWQYCVSDPQSKCHRGDSPLEDAILKDLSEDIEAESKVSVVCRLNMDNPHAENEVQEDVDKIETEKFSNPQLKAADITVTESGSPGEVRPEKAQDGEGEQQWCEEGENTNCGPGTSASSGILTQLASHIFPFSWFFRDP